MYFRSIANRNKINKLGFLGSRWSKKHHRIPCQSIVVFDAAAQQKLSQTEKVLGFAIFVQISDNLRSLYCFFFSLLRIVIILCLFVQFVLFVDCMPSKWVNTTMRLFKAIVSLNLNILHAKIDRKVDELEIKMFGFAFSLLEPISIESAEWKLYKIRASHRWDYSNELIHFKNSWISILFW